MIENKCVWMSLDFAGFLIMMSTRKPARVKIVNEFAVVRSLRIYMTAISILCLFSCKNEVTIVPPVKTTVSKGQENRKAAESRVVLLPYKEVRNYDDCEECAKGQKDACNRAHGVFSDIRLSDNSFKIMFEDMVIGYSGKYKSYIVESNRSQCRLTLVKTNVNNELRDINKASCDYLKTVLFSMNKRNFRSESLDKSLCIDCHCISIKAMNNVYDYNFRVCSIHSINDIPTGCISKSNMNGSSIYPSECERWERNVAMMEFIKNLI